MSMIHERGLPEILESRAEFEAQFERYRGLVRFAVSRFLSDPEQVEVAVENCFLTALRHPVSFEHAGEFRRWLVRIGIDEASEIRSRKLFSYQTEPRRRRNTGLSQFKMGIRYDKRKEAEVVIGRC